MSKFTKVALKNGEGRTAYIRRRLDEGATPEAIHTEINSSELFTGEAPWPKALVNVERRNLAPKAKRVIRDDEPIGEAHPPRAATALPTVPEEYAHLFTPEEYAEIQQEAADRILAEQRKKARAALFDAEMNELRRQAEAEALLGDAKGDLVDVTIDLAPFSDRILINGHPFLHGTTRRVPRNLAKTLQDIMQRTWQHQRDISDPNQAGMYRQRNIRVSPKGAVGAGGLPGYS